MHKVIALIPARGGSKSIPRKNLVSIGGKPLIGWTIEVALRLGFVDRVIVSTDDQEIRAVALEYGAEVPFLRPSAISGDLSTDVEYHIHAVEWLNSNQSYNPSVIMNLRPTMPARDPVLIENAFTLFQANPKADSLRSVEIAQQTPFKMWLVEASGLLKPLVRLDGVREPYNEPRQNLPVVYRQNGYVDFVRTESLFRFNSTTGHYILPFLIERPPSDIDYLTDLEAAEHELYCMINGSGSLAKSSPYGS